jgi:hypothetical protein
MTNDLNRDLAFESAIGVEEFERKNLTGLNLAPNNQRKTFP